MKKPGGERQVLAHVGSLAQVDELHFLSRWEGMRFRSDKARGGVQDVEQFYVRFG